MKSIRLVAGVTVLGFVVAVGCGDDATTKSPGAGGDGSSDGGSVNKGGTPNKGGSANNTSGTNNNDAGMSSTTGGVPGGEGGAGGGPTELGCGNGPACDTAAEECVDGACLRVDGEACSLNAQCIHTCINELCAPRADVLEDCDYAGGGAGAGGAGAGAGGAGVGGAGGEGIYVPPEEIGNGDDLDCLDGLACDSGTCKRKQQTDCTGGAQCLSGLCHNSKCTLKEAGVCTATLCAAPDAQFACAPTTTATNQCSFNYIPNSSCTVDFKGTFCLEQCVCQLTPLK